MTASNKRAWVFILPLLIFILAMFMFYFRLGKETDVKISTSMNKPLPKFHLPLLSDTSRMMSHDELPKTPFLLNVWGSWCPTCKIEHPFLLKLHHEGVPIVGINYKDELSQALSYLNQNQDPFVYSVQDLEGKYALDLGLTGAPETFVVGGDGVVYQHILGEINQDNWSKQIKPCLIALGDASLVQQDKIKVCQ